MGVAKVAARTSELAARQWGLLTTAQAEADGVTRLQLARLADAGVIERVDRGIYATPAAVDEHTPLRAAWLSLEPKILAEERLGDPVASGVISHTSAAALHEVGDLLDDEPEITLPNRKQSRRGIRLHRGTLRTDDVTIVEGLPVTTPARTLADLLQDGQDPSHVAEIAGDMLRRGLASRKDMAIALEPLARRNGQPTGAALLEHLLDLVGLSGAALAANLAASDLGKALVSAGQLEAIKSILETVAKLDLPKNVLDPLGTAAMATLAKNAALPQFSDGVLPKIDVSAIIDAAKFTVPLDTEEFRNALGASVPAWLPEIIRSIPADSWPPSTLTTVDIGKEATPA
ncbi:type IV toxin-antitoxin system AbiEi family antitoxin domain-containing protein [Citricoccus sp. NPDC079358]|uniref:type IV toxin-antitoxin system AbiEi family antitoxin domain-containing protein n=1 Tax=Citricoccus sp. NPDC079358 TaxID=3154653 RepID=UPI00344E682C